MVDQTANFVRGEADSSIAAGDTTISVVNASEFPDPANGQYNLVLWDDGLGRPDQDDDAEIIRVTGQDTTADTLTVLRGQETTTAASHPSDSALQLAPTAKVIDDIVAEKADTDRAVEDFSTNGASGTVPTSQGSGSLAMQSIPKRFDSIDEFNTGGTFDATGIENAYVECIGGGGGGGGETNVGSLAGAGGGGGGYAAAFVDLSNTTSVNVTVGAGGSGGAAGTNDGSAGGNSSFGTLVEAGGGSGGVSNSGPATTAGGSALTGDVLIDGEDGSGDYSVGNQNLAKQPEGGGNVYSNGSGGTFVGSNNSLDGLNGGFPGGGGAGGLENDSGTQVAGGDGADGVVIVYY